MNASIALKHHQAESKYFDWAKYDAASQTLYLCFPSKSGSGTVYAYAEVPPAVFENIRTAKDSTPIATETTRAPIGGETHGSEGSYVIHHVVGRDRKSPIFAFRRLSDEEASAIQNA